MRRVRARLTQTRDEVGRRSVEQICPRPSTATFRNASQAAEQPRATSAPSLTLSKTQAEIGRSQERYRGSVGGLFLWNVTPDFRPLITWLIAGSLVCYYVCIAVGMTVKQAMSAEQLKLNSRLELLDRKVTALLRMRLSNAGFDNPALPVVLIPVWQW